LNKSTTRDLIFNKVYRRVS